MPMFSMEVVRGVFEEVLHRRQTLDLLISLLFPPTTNACLYVTFGLIIMTYPS